MEQDIAHGTNVVRHKYSNEPNFKRKPLFLKFCKKCSRSGHDIFNCPDRRYTKPLDRPNFQEQASNQAMKRNQNVPNKQVTSNNVTGKPLPFSHCSRSNSRDRRVNSRHRSPNKSSHLNSKPYYGNNNFKPPSRNVSPYPRSTNNQYKPNYNTNYTYSITSRPQSLSYNRDGNRSRRPISRNGLRNERDLINSRLDREQTGDTTSNTENAETQNVSEENFKNNNLMVCS